MEEKNPSNHIINQALDYINHQREIFGDFTISATPQETTQSLPLEIEEQPTPIMEVKESIPTPSISLESCTTLEELRAVCLEADVLKTDLENTNLVFGVGNPNADLMIVGEAPGMNEDLQGEPFVGKAGKLLNEVMAAINFDRSTIYIANILKHRPPDNRDPNPDERKRSLPYLLRQIELINPKLVLCVGRISATTLLGNDLALKDMRQKYHKFHGRELMVTYHPAALLRNSNWKRPCWEDVQMLRKRYDELDGKP